MVEIPTPRDLLWISADAAAKKEELVKRAVAAALRKEAESGSSRLLIGSALSPEPPGIEAMKSYALTELPKLGFSVRKLSDDGGSVVEVTWGGRNG